MLLLSAMKGNVYHVSQNNKVRIYLSNPQTIETTQWVLRFNGSGQSCEYSSSTYVKVANFVLQWEGALLIRILSTQGNSYII